MQIELYTDVEYLFVNKESDDMAAMRIVKNAKKFTNEISVNGGKFKKVTMEQFNNLGFAWVGIVGYFGKSSIVREEMKQYEEDLAFEKKYNTPEADAICDYFTQMLRSAGNERALQLTQEFFGIAEDDLLDLVEDLME
jgi:hypothetical protein